MVKALIFDLDGTIISSRTNSYSSAVADAIAALRQKGILLIAATGRSPYELHLTKMIKGLYFDAVVCLNGQYCYTGTEELLLEPFSPEQLNRLLPLIEASGFPCAVIRKNDTFINFSNSNVESAQRDIHMPVPDLRELSYARGEEVLMLTVFVPEEENTSFLPSLSGIIAARWHPYAVDLVPEGSGKCRGIEVVLRHFGVDWEDSYAFGDGDNDYEMLRRAGKGFAMQNGNKRLLSGEFEVIDSVDNDGVPKALHSRGIL